MNAHHQSHRPALPAEAEAPKLILKQTTGDVKSAPAPLSVTEQVCRGISVARHLASKRCYEASLQKLLRMQALVLDRRPTVESSLLHRIGKMLVRVRRRDWAESSRL